jgi:hypothetical protein
MEYLGPFDAQGQPYPQVEFETDINGSAYQCNTATGADCDVPPLDANFYPFYSLSKSTDMYGFSPQQTGNLPGMQGTSCVWTFGNDLPTTVQDFGRDAEYGSPDLSWYGGTSISAPVANPDYTGRCAQGTKF